MTTHPPRKRSNSYLLEDPQVRAAELKRLRLQAEKMFGLELPELKRQGFRSPQSILDIGCGTGIYLSLLGQEYPKAALMGIDHNHHLLEEARQNCPGANWVCSATQQENQLAELLQNYAPEAILCRFVLQHLLEADIRSLLEMILKNKPKRTRLYLLDPDDSMVNLVPPSPAISRLIDATIKRQAAHGGNRLIGSTLSKLLQDVGFSAIEQTQINLGNQNLSWPECEAIFLPVWGSGISANSAPEILENLKAAQDWFHCADQKYRLEYPVFIVSGA